MTLSIKETFGLEKNKMENSDKEDRVEKMLQLIQERLAAYPIEETIERLHSYGGKGPTIDEFLGSFDNKETDLEKEE